jgi:heme iron utilization protein
MSIAEISPSRKHAYTDTDIPQLPQPTYAERVRTLVSLSTIAMLSTVSRKRPGYPFGSLMPYAIDGTGRPIFLISNMAMHTQNIQADPRASLFVGQVGDAIRSAARGQRLLGMSFPCHRMNSATLGNGISRATKTAAPG